MNGNFYRERKTLQAIEVNLQLGQQAKEKVGEITFACTQTEGPSEIPSAAVLTQEQEVQTEFMQETKGEEDPTTIQTRDKIEREEKEIQTLEQELSELLDSASQTEGEIFFSEQRHSLPDEGSENLPPLTEGGRTSACTQTLSEGVCEVEVQTDYYNGGQSVSQAGRRPPTYPGSPGDEMVTPFFLLIGLEILLLLRLSTFFLQLVILFVVLLVYFEFLECCSTLLRSNNLLPKKHKI
jgi:hypothetical protein